MLKSFLAYLLLATTLATCGLARADGPADNVPENVRPIPKPGIELPAADREQLERGLTELASLLGKLRANIADDPIAKPESWDLYADVAVFHRAVDQAVRHQEFFDAKEIPLAHKLIQQGLERARQLQAGTSPWQTQTGLVVRGYLSKIDRTVQPYGVVIPDNAAPRGETRLRCDLWFHGRGETLSEVNFLQQRLTSRGEYTPANTLVLHPYGRYCNAAKFAGEIDALEALAAVERQYAIDPRRISVRGFSMGGASAWQFAVHYPHRWFAANPGAGFAETPDFLKVFQSETVTPTWYERQLWHWYDCTDWSANLTDLPVVAYSGDQDRQKQAADIMSRAMRQEGLELLHVVGPNTGHKIHADSKTIIERQLDAWAAQPPVRPHKLRFVTYTLGYPRGSFVEVLGLAEHWQQARVEAEKTEAGEVRVTTRNVTELRFAFPPEWLPPGAKSLKLDGQEITGLDQTCIKHNGQWIAGSAAKHVEREGALRKNQRVHGPIDDAFLDSFIFVKPSGECWHPQVSQWVAAEMEHAITHWRRQMRGDAVVKLDTEITPADMRQSHLVLWGDPRANKLLGQIADKLPLRWQEDRISAGERHWESPQHAIVAIYPNPLAPQRYVVLNSGFTYREYDYLNNARQVPKLPDWAIVDLRTPPNSRWPGNIAAADFFNETWGLKPPHAE